MSADATWIIYTHTVNPENNSAGPVESDVYTIRITGGAEKPLFTGPTWDEDPEWSPDGRRIVFTRRPAKVDYALDAAQAYVANADGSSPEPLASMTGVVSPTWSPDGTQVAFIRQVRGDASRAGPAASELWITAAEGGAPRRVLRLDNTPLGLDSYKELRVADWSPTAVRSSWSSSQRQATAPSPGRYSR